MEYVLIAIWLNMAYHRPDWYSTSMQEFSSIETCTSAKKFLEEHQDTVDSKKMKLECVPK